MKVDQILIYIYFQVNKDLECTYLFSNCTYYNHNISNFSRKNYFEDSINSSVSKLLITYFYYTKVIKILYSTYHKPNRGHDGFICLLIRLFYLFFCAYVKNCLNYKLDFSQLLFHAFALGLNINIKLYESLF